MKLSIRLKICILFILTVVLLYFFKVITKDDAREFQIQEQEAQTSEVITEKSHFKKNDIIVAVVACGDRLHETLNMIKSALMFTREKLNFIVISEDALIESFREKLRAWQELTNNKFSFKVMPLTFPKNNEDEWKQLFKPCASQRLFLPDVLSDVDSILYMDTDTLFLTPPESIWGYLHRMNGSQMAALAPEHEDPNVGWYNRFARHPYYGKLGVNSGVMLMNLTRMRLFKWTDYVVPIYKKYKLKITWGDQDIINIIFYYHPDKLLIYSCRYNYRSDHCMYMSVCKEAEKDGIAVMHGSRGFFHSGKQPLFQITYQAIQEFQLDDDLNEFLNNLEYRLEDTQNTNCGLVRKLVLKNVKN